MMARDCSDEERRQRLFDLKVIDMGMHSRYLWDPTAFVEGKKGILPP
jgi:hypothetical protein